MRDYLDDQPIRLRGFQAAVTNFRRPLLLGLLLCAVALVLIVLDQWGQLGPTRGVLNQVINPVAQQFAGARNGTGGFWASIMDIPHLQAENQRLQQENSQLKADAITYERVLAENTYLRQQLAIEQEQPWQLLGAEVTVRTPDAGRRVMHIARGSNDGVQVGMAVIGQTGSEPAALVGVVEDVGPHTASVLLITDFGSRISTFVLQNSSIAMGLVQGQWQHGSRLRLEQLERGVTLQEGAVVVSAGMTGQLDLPMPLARIPENVPIGTVETISVDGHAQVAELRPYVDPDQVSYVWVILSDTR
ncbi:MAG: rod shape-determining protein MreC [Chloroflexaceae bacterium]|nr:rod shape-determining protein MreC [Chloroflexaceae bacterium]